MTQSLVDLIMQGMRVTEGSKTAITTDEELMTFRQLLTGAQGIAATLVQSGIGRGDRVGIWMDKTPACVQSLLGILMAGAAYVPMDPKAPWRRCKLILENCGFACLIVDTPRFQHLPSLIEGATVRLVLVKGEVNKVLSVYFNNSGQHYETLDRSMLAPSIELPLIDSQDLAYILYTSGSTGTPKGVMHTHGSAIAFVNWIQRTFEITSCDVFSSHAPFHFDLSISDLFASLSSGASVRLISTTEAMLAPYLVKKLDEWGITVWYSVPSILSAMLDVGNLEETGFGKVRTILFAGEVFPIQQLRRLRKALPNVCLANLFGPTETNVCNYYIVPKHIPDEQTVPIPIGRACEHMEAFVLDDALKEVVDGEEGNLWIKGGNLMQGYWNDPVRTKTMLRPDPQGQTGLAYCTGDLVRLKPDGNYSFFGRRDHMIKTRGYRVELGEIENVVNCHPAVLEAVASALPDPKIGSRIMVSAMICNGDRLEAGDLRNFCRERLPAYMIPEQLEIRADLPRTSTGKVDRQILLVEWKNKELA